jgi:surfeit locus 1 family protein
MSEPGGAFLRANAPGENRWYSRDVEAIAQTQQLPSVAPYFIDAEAGGNGQVAPGARADLETPGAMASPNGGSVNRDGTGGGVPLSANGGTVGNGASAGGPLAADPGQPIPGLTVVTFRNSHLSYAITWFLLALLTAGFGVLVARTR